MATWGGSTADNLESIEEDEDGSGAGQEAPEDDEMDDGYPSDGIVQVEEEEEADAESDGRDTYTIEDEYHARARQNVPRPNIDPKARHRGRRSNRGRGRPRKQQIDPPFWTAEGQRKRQETVCPAEDLIEDLGDGRMLLMQNDLQTLHNQLQETQQELQQLKIQQAAVGKFNKPLLLISSTSHCCR